MRMGGRDRQSAEQDVALVPAAGHVQAVVGVGDAPMLAKLPERDVGVHIHIAAQLMANRYPMAGTPVWRQDQQGDSGGGAAQRETPFVKAMDHRPSTVEPADGSRRNLGSKGARRQYSRRTRSCNPR